MWVRVRGDLQAFRQMVLYQVHLNQGWAISLALCATSRAQNQEKTTKAAEQECNEEEDTHGVQEVEAEDHGGNQPLRISWWQQSFSCFLCPQPDSGHQGWDWWVPEGTKLHSECFILSYPTANRVCVFLPWLWFYNLESEQHTFQPPNFDPRKTAAKFRQTTTFPPEF